jgi:hypothetical protein
MGETNTGAAPQGAPNAGEGAAQGAPPPNGQQGTAPNGGAPGGVPPAAPPAETIRIGDHEVSIDALAALPEADLDRVLKKLKRKVRSDGKDVEIDLLEALSLVPKAHRADRAVWEASEMRKAIEGVMQDFPRDPSGAVAKMFGVDRSRARQLLEEHVYHELQYEGLKPEERKRVDEERSLREKAARADEYEKVEKKRREEADVAAHVQTIGEGLTSALTAAGMQPSEWAMRRAASAMEAMIGAAGRDLTAAELQAAYRKAAEFTRDEIERERGSHLETDDDDELIRRVGEERAKRIARAIGAKAKKGAPPARAPAGSRAAPPPPRKSFQDLRDELEERDRKGEW